MCRLVFSPFLLWTHHAYTHHLYIYIIMFTHYLALSRCAKCAFLWRCVFLVASSFVYSILVYIIPVIHICLFIYVCYTCRSPRTYFCFIPCLSLLLLHIPNTYIPWATALWILDCGLLHSYCKLISLADPIHSSVYITHREVRLQTDYMVFIITLYLYDLYYYGMQWISFCYFFGFL